MSKNELKTLKKYSVYSKRYNAMMESCEKLGIDSTQLRKLIQSTIKLYNYKH